MSRRKKLMDKLGGVITTAATAKEVSEEIGADVEEDGVRVVSEEEAEKADFVICSPDWIPSAFTDDISGTCSECGQPIHYRPHTPKRPPKLCITCGLDRAYRKANEN